MKLLGQFSTLYLFLLKDFKRTKSIKKHKKNQKAPEKKNRKVPTIEMLVPLN